MPEKKNYQHAHLDDLQNIQVRFLNVAFDQEPEMQRKLADDVAPLGPLELFEAPSERYREALVAWAESFGINVEWILNAVHCGIPNWKNGYFNKPFIVVGSRGSPIAFEESHFSFFHCGWDPLFTPEKKAISEIREAFERELEQYTKRIKKKIEGLEIPKLPDFRKGLTDCLRWLVMYQIQEMAIEDIVECYPTFDESYVRKQIKQLGEFLSLKTK